MQEQQGKLAFLLDWVADDEKRDDTMSYACHRRLFDAFQGPKTEVGAG